MYFPIDEIETMIYTIRGQRVMLDSDLAKLYGVETKRLNEQIKRNSDRFPSDFMIVPTISELCVQMSPISARGQNTTTKKVFKFTPNLFTENGVAMLSSILKSKQAIQVNITIMRTFTKLRSFLAMESSPSRLEDLEEGMKGTHKLFKVVFERLDSIENQIEPKLTVNRKKIGLKVR